MNKHYLFILAVMGMASTTHAIDLPAAKSQGLVCESTNGYVSPRGNPSPDVQQMIVSVNEQRQKEYARLGAQNGTSEQQVAQTTAQLLRSRDANAAC